MTPKGHSPVDLDPAAPATSRRGLIGALGAVGLAGAAALSIARPASAAPTSPTEGDKELLCPGDAARADRSSAVRTSRRRRAVRCRRRTGHGVRREPRAYADEIAGAAGFSADSRNEEVFEQLESAFDTSDDEAFAEIANTLENTAAATHTSLLPEYESVNARKITASIIVVEARMATVLSDFGGLASDFDEALRAGRRTARPHRGSGVMNRSTASNGASRYGRRDALKLGGLTVSVAALVAACGNDRTGDDVPGRVGYAPPITDPPDYPIDDAVLLRTASSLELTAGRRLRDDPRRRRARGRSGRLVERLIEDHQAVADEMGELTDSVGGTAWECTNPWYMNRLVEPLLAAIAGQRRPDARHPQLRQRVGEHRRRNPPDTHAGTRPTRQPRPQPWLPPHSSRAMLRRSSRHRAVPEGYVSPTIGGGGVASDAQGIPLKFAITDRFGSTGQIELTVGAPDENGVRETFILPDAVAQRADLQRARTHLLSSRRTLDAAMVRWPGDRGGACCTVEESRDSTGQGAGESQVGAT